MTESDRETIRSPTHSLGKEVVQPPSPDMLRFPSAVSTPVSSSDIIAMENLRKKASAGTRNRPGRYGFFGDPEARAAALAASQQAAMEEDDPQDVPLIHVIWPNSAEAEEPSNSSGPSGAFQTPKRPSKTPKDGYPAPEPPAPPYQKKQKVSGLLSNPQRPRCCGRFPKPFTIIVATLVLALVLIIGLLVGHFAAPYIRTMTIMQPAGVSAPGTAPYTGLGAPGASDGRGIEGAGIGLETDQLITRDQSPTAAKNPYLDKNRSGAESSGLSPLSPGGV